MVSKKIVLKTKYLFIASLLIIIFSYIFKSFNLNEYEILFIDEKLIIDDIYNIWLIDDIFGRYDNVNNNFLKSILIIFTELVYGGDLRYGRLWSNYFTMSIGLFSLVSDEVLISSVRILNTLTMFIGSFFIVKNNVKKKYLWLALFSIYSLPGISYLSLIPKPESLSLLFLGIGFYYFQKNNIYKSIFCFSVATFLKINMLIFLIIFGIFIFFKYKENKIKFLIKSIFTTFSAMVFVNPVLIIPPLKLGSMELPNFYKVYFQWISSQSTYGDDLTFNVTTFKVWFKSLSQFYLINSSSIENIFSFLFFLLLLFVIFKSLKSRDLYNVMLVISAISYLIFYMFFVERQFLWYLTFPLILLIIGFLRNLENIDNLLIRNASLYLFIIFSAVGNISNLIDFNNQKIFTANSSYGYENIDKPEDAINQINEIHKIIENIYFENKQLKNNLVYWHPNLFYPRNYVTYENNYFIRDYWGSKDNPLNALENADIFVTYTIYENIDGLEIRNFENLYLYYSK